MPEEEENKPARTKRQQIKDVIGARYEFFFNVIKQKPEFRELKEEEEEWRPVDKYDLNTMVGKLDAVGVQTSPDILKQILESDFVPKRNPIQHYFGSLEDYDQYNDGDPIAELCSTVETADGDGDFFYRFFKKWIVGVMANAMDDRFCRNHVCLVLTGEQGTFKTSFLETLCPDGLDEYIYTGKIDPTHKDAMTLVAEYLFVNIDDQLKQLNKKSENDLKELITKNRVKYRRPYDPYVTEYPHLASFMASVNGNDFLTDVTGSRRFLPFEVKSIDLSRAKSLNMDRVYAYAKALWQSGFQYWIDDKEQEELESKNEHFEVKTQEEELAEAFFEVPKSWEGAEEHLNTSQVLSRLQEYYSIRNLRKRRLGEALQKLGFEKKPKRNNTGKPTYLYGLNRRIQATTNQEAQAQEKDRRELEKRKEQEAPF